jgi:hypothetical protein
MVSLATLAPFPDLPRRCVGEIGFRFMFAVSPPERATLCHRGRCGADSLTGRSTSLVQAVSTPHREVTETPTRVATRAPSISGDGETELKNAITVVAIAATVLACRANPPQVTRPPPYPLALGGVYVTVNRGEYQAAAVEGLRSAGVPIAEGPKDLQYMLTVDIGSAQGASQSCGTLRNVRYTLNYAVVPQARVQRTEVESPIGSWAGQSAGVGGRAIQMRARGYDGTCPSNVFNQMGAALRQQMSGELKIIDPGDRFYEEDPRFKKLRTDWVHRAHASDSDVYYSNQRECMDESKVILRGSGDVKYDEERFEVCMKSLGWRPE